MVLHAERRFVAVADSLDGLIVEVDVGYFERLRKTFGIQGEVVVLRGDLDLAGEQVADRVIAAVMAELQSAAGGAAGDAEQLVPEADPHQRDASEQGADHLRRVTDCRRVGRTVGEEDPVRLLAQHASDKRAARCRIPGYHAIQHPAVLRKNRWLCSAGDFGCWILDLENPEESPLLLLPEVSNVFYDEARDALYYPARRLPRIYEVKFK